MVTGERQLWSQTLSEEETNLIDLVDTFVYEVLMLDTYVGCALRNDGNTCYTSSNAVSKMEENLSEWLPKLDKTYNDIVSTAGSEFEKLKDLRGFFDLFNAYDSERQRLVTIHLTKDGHFALKEQEPSVDDKTPVEIVADFLKVYANEVEEFEELVDMALDPLAKARANDPSEVNVWDGKTYTIPELKDLLYDARTDVYTAKSELNDFLKEEHGIVNGYRALHESQYTDLNLDDDFKAAGDMFNDANNKLLMPEWVSMLRPLFKTTNKQGRSFKLGRFHRALNKAEGGNMKAWDRLTAASSTDNQGNFLRQMHDGCMARGLNKPGFEEAFDATFEYFAAPNVSEDEFCDFTHGINGGWIAPTMRYTPMKSWNLPEPDLEGLSDLAGSALI